MTKLGLEPLIMGGEMNRSLRRNGPRSSQNEEKEVGRRKEEELRDWRRAQSGEAAIPSFVFHLSLTSFPSHFASTS